MATAGLAGAGALGRPFVLAGLSAGEGPLIDLKPLHRGEATRWQRPETRLHEGSRQPRQGAGIEAPKQRGAQALAAITPELSPHAATRFVVQLLGQNGLEDSALRLDARHRDAPRLTSEAYRRAGGEPAADGGEAQLFSFAV